VSNVAENSGTYIGSLVAAPDQQNSTRLIAGSSRAVYVPQNGGAGHVLFVREGTLMGQLFDHRRLELAGAPFAIAERVGEIGLGYFSAAANGVLAYRKDRSAGDSQLTWFSRDGKPLNTGLKLGLAEFALSRDGASVVGGSNPLLLAPGIRAPARVSDIWLGEFERGTTKRLTSHPAAGGMPVWSPDGKRIVFASSREGRLNLYSRAIDGDSEELLLKSGEDKLPLDWSRDGRFVLYSSNDGKTGDDLWVLPLKHDGKPSGSPELYLRTQFNEGSGRFSPDGRWVAYRSNASLKDEIYIQSFPASSNRKQWVRVSTNGGSTPRWRGDGRELFYIEPGGKLMVVEITPGPELRVKGTPKHLFVAPIFGGPNMGSWEVSSDGNRFLINTNADASRDQGSITVLVNWQSLLKQ